MKHIRQLIYLLLAAVALTALVPQTAMAQAQINTKKVKICDFTEKTTKVVTTGNVFYDNVLKDEITARWRISPFEFCSLKDFEELKENDNFYFLITTKGQFRRESEPGLQFLTLVKGGKKAENGIDDMLEIVSIPLCSADSPSGRELLILPAYLDIIQNFTLDSMEKDINGYTGLANYTMNLADTKGLDVIISEEDLGNDVDMEKIKSYERKGIKVLEEDDADEYIINQTPGVLVSYVAAPTDAKSGSYCYKLLIDITNNRLCYFRKHRISKKVGAGFLQEDIKRIAISR